MDYASVSGLLDPCERGTREIFYRSQPGPARSQGVGTGEYAARTSNLDYNRGSISTYYYAYNMDGAAVEMFSGVAVLAFAPRSQMQTPSVIAQRR